MTDDATDPYAYSVMQSEFHFSYPESLAYIKSNSLVRVELDASITRTHDLLKKSTMLVFAFWKLCNKFNNVFYTFVCGQGHGI